MVPIWRPLKKVERDAVAICDPNAIDMERDLAEHINKQPSDKGDYLAGLSMLRRNHVESQKWYCISDMDTDEVLVIQFHDSHAIREEHCGGRRMEV